MKPFAFLSLLAFASASHAFQPVAVSSVGATVDTSTAAAIPVDWKTIKSDYGWSLSYPPDWDVFVFSENNMNPRPEEGRGVNFTGPRGCYKDARACGLFRMSLVREAPMTLGALAKLPSVMFGSAQGFEAAPGNWYVSFDDNMWNVTFGPNGPFSADAGRVEETMKAILATLRFGPLF